MESSESELSLIDCGVKSMSELALRPGLRSLNLHSNQVARIDNLAKLHNLVHLDLSSNQIAHIAGLDALRSLHTLNLACNRLAAIDNLSALRHLRLLNLAYNQIEHLTGLSELWGDQYALHTLHLHANFLVSLEDSLFYLSGLARLQHLTMHDNKRLKITGGGGGGDYRPLVFSNCKQLVSLDGRDKLNRPTKAAGAVDLPNVADLNFGVVAHTPPIKLSTEHNQTHQQELQKPKLSAIEEKIHQLVEMRDSIRRLNKGQQETTCCQTKSKHNKASKKHSKSARSCSSCSSCSSSSSSSSSSSCSNERSFRSSKSSSSPKQPAKIVGILKQQQQHAQTQQAEVSPPLTPPPPPLQETNNSQHRELVELLQAQLAAANKQHNDTLVHHQQQVAELKQSVEQANSARELACTQLASLDAKHTLVCKERDDLSARVTQLSSQVSTAAEDKHKMRKQFKAHLQVALAKERAVGEQASRAQADELNARLRALEDEFRSALVIESQRYEQLAAKNVELGAECGNARTELLLARQSDERNKALIGELSQLIKEQKARLQQLARLRKDNVDDVHKRNEKLSEAVADCVRLKTELDACKRQCVALEAARRQAMAECEEIRDEKHTWSKRMSEQKMVLSEESGRLEVECRALCGQLEAARKALEEERDCVRIKAKIVDDQTESIKKLKSAVLERDEQLRTCRDDALAAQRSLEAQLGGEMETCNELQLKCERAVEKREAMRLERDQAVVELDKARADCDQLTAKFEQVRELDARVRHMQAEYASKEATLIGERDSLAADNVGLLERLRRVDDDFRRQYDVEKREHLRLVEKLKREYEEKLAQAEARTCAIEDEMREVLAESAAVKKAYEEKAKSYSAIFAKMQQDFIS